MRTLSDIVKQYRITSTFGYSQFLSVLLLVSYGINAQPVINGQIFTSANVQITIKDNTHIFILDTLSKEESGIKTTLIYIIEGTITHNLENHANAKIVYKQNKPQNKGNYCVEKQSGKSQPEASVIRNPEKKDKEQKTFSAGNKDAHSGIWICLSNVKCVAPHIPDAKFYATKNEVTAKVILGISRKNDSNYHYSFGFATCHLYSNTARPPPTLQV